jgi:hypothetical protein
MSGLAVAVLLQMISPALPQGAATGQSAPQAGGLKARNTRDDQSMRLIVAGVVKALQNQAGEKKPTKPRRARNTRGIPKGVQACLDRLIKIASADPLPPYGGQAEQIINGGLLWHDAKSRCSIGEDQSLRLKVAEVVKAWRSKDAAQVRSLLQELKSAAPQS